MQQLEDATTLTTTGETPPPGYRYYTIVIESGDGTTAEQKYLLTDAQYLAMNYVAEVGDRQSRSCEKRLDVLKVQHSAPSSQWSADIQKNHPIEMAHLRMYQENLFTAVLRMATELDGANRVMLSPEPSSTQLALAKKVFITYEKVDQLADPFAYLSMPEVFRDYKEEDPAPACVGDLV